MELSSNPPASSLVGQVVSGRYRIDKLIGEGGMGAVYLAEHTHMRKRVALKLLHAEMSQDEEILARFRREAEAAAHVEHPNVASATDFGQTEDGSFFLVLEYVEGTSLRVALDRGPMLPARALHITRQIAFALERAHGAGIVHRDLKPENIMLVTKGDDPDFVKVLDFGIAKVQPQSRGADPSQPLTRLGTILGTPEYMAPEQALGETVGPAADLYAVGVMLYEMLTGLHPFDAPDRMAVLSMHIVAPVPAMCERNPALPPIPPPVEQLARKLLEKDAKLRPANARALADEIDMVAGQSGIELAQSGRGFSSRESFTGLPRGSDSRQEVAPPSQQWNAADSLAKTDYGLPAAQPPAQVSTQRSFGTVSGLPPWLKPLEQLPRSVLFAIAGAIPIMVLALIVTLILARRSATNEADEAGVAPSAEASGQPAPGTRASPAKLSAAKAQGVSALKQLAEDFPQDPDVHRQLAIALANADRSADLLPVVSKLIKLDKDAIDDALVQAVVTAAQRADTADDAFALLEGPLGPRGIDALLELSTNKSASTQTRNRATRSLARSDVRAAASPATSVMLDLKAAKSCTDKHELLDRAKEHGDARILPSLKALKSPRGCGFMGMRDCWSCLRRDDALDEAIRAVEARPSK